MVTKTVWTPLIALTLLLTGCATLTNSSEALQNQREANQPEMSELDAEAVKPTVPEITESVNTTGEVQAPTNVTQPTPAVRQTQDPGADAVANNAATEPAPSPEQVVIRLQQLALQLQSEGKWQEAETVLQRALRIDVQKVDIYHQLATVRMGQQRFTEAEQIAMKGLTYTDKSPKFKASLWEVIAQCRSAQGDIDGANEARDEMLKWMTP